MNPKHSLSEEDSDLLKRAKEWHGTKVSSQPLTSQELARIHKEHGLSFATACLYEAVSRQPSNAEFSNQASISHGRPSPSDLIGLIPGAFYQKYQDTGAGGARVMDLTRSLGYETEIIPVGNFDDLDRSAEVILDWLDSHTDRRITLISLSKGSAEVKRALSSTRSAHAFSNVNTWISLSGMVHGSPLVEWIKTRPPRWWGVQFLFWWNRLQIKALEHIRHEPDATLDKWPQLPAGLRIVHVYGIPLRKHLTHKWAPKGYERISHLGPNDGGGILLSDLLRVPGIVYPIWGVDHYLSPAWDINSLLRGIISAAIEAPRQANQSATPPSIPPATRSSA